MEQVAWILALLLAFIVAPLVLWSRRERRGRRGIPSTPDTPEQTVGQEIIPSTSTTERSSSGGTRRMRRRPVSAAASSSSSSTSSIVAVSEPDMHDGDQDASDMIDATFYKPKQSKKKNERKHEKETRKEAEIAAREMKKEKQDRQAELRRQKDEEHEAEEAQKEKEAERQRLKEEEAAAAEFEKWKSAFSVDTEGTEQETEEEGQGLLNGFVDYIKGLSQSSWNVMGCVQKHKCVALEDLAAEFNLRTQDCINRVMALEQMGRISGVMDERGKFIYISPEEMKAVADYIKRLGRVSISHLASKSNEFIDLESKTLASDCAQEADPANEPFLPGPQISVG